MGKLDELTKQADDLWKELDDTAKKIIICLAGITVIIILLLLLFSGQSDFDILYTNLELKDAGLVIERLEEMNIPYELQDEGRKILVPEDQVHQTRISLAGEGLPERGAVGFEVFDQTDLGTTDFERNVNLHRALQGELARTISRIEGIEEARVHLVIPQERLFLEDQQKPEGSVVVRLSPGASLNSEMVNAISNLVAKSVEDLAPEKIAILDTQGSLFSAENLSEHHTTADNLSARQIEVRRSLEKDLERSLQSMLLPIFGYENVVVRVNTELNFDLKEIESELFEPVIDDDGIIRSREELEEYFDGQSPAAESGVPGFDSNIPTYEEEEWDSSSTYERRNVVENYEINRSIISEHIAPGQLERLSVSVIVNSELGPSEINELQNIISSAAGINSERGDSVSVSGMEFEGLFPEPEIDEKDPVIPIKYYISGLLFLVLGFCLYIIKKIKERREREKEKIAEDIAEREAAVGVESLSEQEKEREKIRKELEELVRKRPEDVANILKTWLKE